MFTHTQDFYHEDMQCPEVDLVLSSAEFWTCLEHIHNNYSTLTGINVSQVSSTLTTDRPTTTTTTTTTSSTATAASYNMDSAPFLTTTPALSTTTTNSSSSDSPTTAYDRTSAFLHSLPSDPTHGRDPLETLLRAFSTEGTRLVHAVEANSGSGGYLEYIARYMATYLNSHKPTNNNMDIDTDTSSTNKNNTNTNNNASIYTESLPYIQGRNTDIAEIDLSSLVNYTLKPPLKLSKIYGFRNIQSVILKLKRNKCDISFIEVMACPSGCINGKIVVVL